MFILQRANRLLSHFVFFTAIAIAPSTQAKIYSWVDEDGKTHFTDIATIHDSQEITVKKSPANLSLEVQERKVKKKEDKNINQNAEQPKNDSVQARVAPPANNNSQKQKEIK